MFGDADPLRHSRWRTALFALYVGAIAVVNWLHFFGRHHLDNNFLIYRWAFSHLRSGVDLYVAYPQEHQDLFKYSPTFAALFAPFALVPVWLGSILWDSLNVFFLWFAVERLLPERRSTLVLSLIALEVLRSMQRSQSNALVTGVVILAFVAFEQRRTLAAAINIAVGAAIKIFPLAALSLAAMYPRRFRFALRFAAVMVLTVLLPLCFISPAQLWSLYQSWSAVERVDTLSLSGPGGAGLYSGVTQQLQIWFGVQWPNWPVQLAGTAVLLAPIAGKRSCWSDGDFRIRFLASLLVYMVIFNHQAASPTFVVAVTGIAIWFVSTPMSWTHRVMMALTLLFVSVGSTSIVPRPLALRILIPYRVKTLPCLAAWIVMQVELWRFTLAGRRSESSEVHQLDVAALEAHS